MRTLTALALLAAAGLSACTTAEQAIRGPQLTPIGYPSVLVPQDQQTMLVSARDPAPFTHAANSLWRSGARAFFADQRAARVGDILTVQIDIDDSATTTNSTNSSRSSSASLGVPHLFGLESSISKIFPGGYDPSAMVETNSDHANAGAGSVTRKEKISLTVAAIVTQVLPNGNMVIQGTQEVRTNAEVRQLTVAGIVRPEDISAANTIRHTQIAEARISYGGRGDISRVQKTPAGQSLIEQFSPF
jgi:flagellar L-ring protein precursor FlgH